MQDRLTRIPPDDRIGRTRNILSPGLLVYLWLTSCIATAAPPYVRTTRQAFDTTFAAKLSELADKADAIHHNDLGEIIRQWHIPRYDDRQYVFLPPLRDTRDPAKTPKYRLNDAQDIYDAWIAARHEQADQLAELSEQALVRGDAEDAIQLLYEVLRERPEDMKTRRALGLGKPGGKKTSQPVTARTAHQGYGWPAGTYWRMQTDHFLITTNHSLQAAEELGVVLEEFHSVWEQLFVSFWTTPQAVRQSISGRGMTRRPTARYKVVLFKNQQEYTDHFRRSEPQAGMTLGIYRDKQRTAFFFAGKDTKENNQLQSTWRHEIAHQLFYESLRHSKRIAEQQNFWIVEAIALYLESSRRILTCGTTAEGDVCPSVYYTVGGFESRRLQYARYRALNEQYRIPLHALSQMSRTQLQSDPSIRRLYTQSAGLAHFLIDGNQGSYRDAMIQTLRSVYTSSDDLQTLPELCQTTFSELDTQYLRFLRVEDKQMPALRTHPNVTELALGRTGVTDKGMKSLESLQSLTWLDLAYCDVSDAGLKHLSPLLPLTRLNLEATKITGSSLERISKWSTLTELDLSQTAIDDSAMSEIAELKQLRVLWLTGTQITDQGLRELASLKQLETLDVSQTRVTRKAWDAIKKELPKLKTIAQP